MSTQPSPSSSPSRVAVIGGGMVGLATAWFLQERGLEVTVYERDHVAAGSSWGNAGWLTPGITTPLPEPAVLKYGIKAVMSPSSPVYVPPKADPSLIRFLLGFVGHSTTKAWQRAMNKLVPVNRLALAAFDTLTENGVKSQTRPAEPFIAAYRSEDERKVLLEELEHIRDAGQGIEVDVVTGEEARAAEPALSTEVKAALLLHGQRFINPGEFVNALADSVRSRGGKVTEGVEITRVDQYNNAPAVWTSAGPETYDAVVVATGAWLNRLAKPLGVKRIVQAGRGYSFSVAVPQPVKAPIYFPAQRVACTPLGDRLRVAGMMEFRSPDAALDSRRIKAIVDAARPLLAGVNLDDRQDEWVGSRPCTADGLPLIGATAQRGVYVAGGHGMWGISLG
ncbi:MAG TPA: FAD-dependent oxidoreductase, partial [Nocardioidaceae bacterium]|nr:FAD-dependent oxidoreductase [Nocardioidaceae bacterium]